MAQVILYIYAYNYIKYRIKIRAIATDAHPSFTARELDSLKFDLGIVFEVLGRYRTHVDSSAERYIRQVLANAHMALSGLRGKAVAGSQVDPNNYYIFAISYTIDFMNGTASTSLARREGVINSPRGILSNHASQDDAPSSVFPFGCRVYWKPPDRHKREDLAEPAYYLCSANMCPIRGINTHGPLTEDHREHLLLTRSGSIVTTAQFEPEDLTQRRQDLVT